MSNTRVVINTFQRASSLDVNNLQENLATDQAQALRRLNQRFITGLDNWEFPVNKSDLTALPVTDFGTVHDAFGGLLVRPDAAGYLLVDPGSAGFQVPGFAATYSDYVLVDDPGVTSITALTFTANGSGDPRIDIIECQPVLQTTTGSRDIFDPVTQQFTGTTVDVQTTVILSYRIRLGTPGAGFPVIEQDWMPLAFSVMQDGASGFNEVDFFDVRPLVSERTNRRKTMIGSTQTIRGSAAVTDRSIRGDSNTDMSGWWVGEFNGYYTGGSIKINSASSLVNFGQTGAGGGSHTSFDTDLTENMGATGSAPIVANGQLNVVMAYFPRQLGRCVRYSQNATSPQVDAQVVVSGRQPLGSSGILVHIQSPSVTATGSVVLANGGLGATFGSGAGEGLEGYGQLVGWTFSNSAGDFVVCPAQGKRFNIPLEISQVDTEVYATVLEDNSGVGTLTFLPSYTPVGATFSLNLVTNPNSVPNTASIVNLYEKFSIQTTVSDSDFKIFPGWADWGGNPALRIYTGSTSQSIYAQFSPSDQMELQTGGTYPLNGRTNPDDGGSQNTVIRRFVSSTSAFTTFPGENIWQGTITGWEEN